MDIAARLDEVKSITSLFAHFNTRGAEAYATVAPQIIESMDQQDGAYLAALDAALLELAELAATSANAAIASHIDDLSKQVSKRISRLVDVSDLAAKHFAILSNLTGERGPGELRAAGVSARRIAALYPFDLREHMPAICAYTLHGEAAVPIASTLRGNDALVAWSAFDEIVTPGFITHDTKAMQRAYKIANDYLRATYGPYQSGVSSQYENVVSLWAYLLTFLHEVAKQQRPAVNARTKQAAMMKIQIRVAKELAALITPAAVAA